MNTKILFSLLTVVVLPAVAWAHGLQMTFHVNGLGSFETDAHAFYGPIVDPVDHHDSVFLSSSYKIGAVTTPSLQFTASPATSNPAASNGIELHSTWGFDLVGPLMYWDPLLGVTPTDVTATIVRSGAGYTVDENSTFVPGGDLVVSGGGYPGTDGFHNSTTVNIPLGSPVGLYAVGFQVRSTVNSSFPNLPLYGHSNTFYAIGTNGLSDADFNRGIEALTAIGIPEPSSIVLLGLGTAGLAMLRWRRKSTSR